jgi:rubredoxin
MDNKNMRKLSMEDLDKVSGGTEDSYDPNGRLCPICEKPCVQLIIDGGDIGMFRCDFCGYEYQDSI